MTRAREVDGEALVLRLVDLGDADRLAVLFFREQGVVTARAKSARASRKRFGGALLLGHRVRARVRLAERSSQLAEASALDSFDGALRDLRRIDLLGRVLRRVEAMIPEGHPEASSYDLTLAFLRELASPDDPPPSFGWFSLRLLDELGFAPSLDACVRCGTPAPESRPAHFSAQAGGLVCRACGGAGAVLSADARALARAYRASSTVPRQAQDDEGLAAALEAFVVAHASPRRGA